MSFGARLRKERLRRHLSQEALAEALGTIPPTISRWERDQSFPRAYHRLALCRLFQMKPEELFEEIPVQEQAASASPLIWHVPYPRNPFFTGREEILQRLHEMFHHRCTLVLTQSLAVSGLGGIGKTQIALEYAYQYRKDYHCIFWIQAASRESLFAGFIMIAQLLKLPEKDERDQKRIIQAVKQWFSTHQDWLLILDNADDIAMVGDYLPATNAGHLLLTSRAQALGSLAQRIEVEDMGLTEGTLFLLRRSKLLAPDAFLDQVSEECLAAAEAIVIEMAFLPLALDQAGAYIDEIGCSLSTYLELYQARRQELLARRGQLSAAYPESVATTWSLSFQKIEQTNPAAAELLRLCAFLQPDAIPYDLITQASASFGPVLQPVAHDPLKLNEAIKELRQFSLVQYHPETNMLRIHRLVQAVLRDTMSHETQRAWAQQAIQATNAVFPVTVDPAVWSLCQRFLPQAQMCSVWIADFALVSAEAASLLLRTAHYLRDAALYELAEPLFRQVVLIREQMLKQEHASMAHSLTGLADLYRQQSKHKEAEQLYQQAVHLWEQSLGVDHPQAATALNGLGLLYSQQGKYQEAEPLFQRALSIREQRLGPDHLQVAASLNGLADLYLLQGKYREAEPLFERAVRIREQNLGLEHPQVANPLTNLAILYFEQSRYEEAEPLFQRARSIREQHLGPDHPQTAISLINVGELYNRQGNYEEAEPLFLEAARILEQRLGPEHPNVALPLHNLAELYREQGNYEEAESLFRLALHILEQNLGPESPDVAYPLYNLAQLYRKQGTYEQAEPLFLRVLSIREQKLGLEHPLVATSLAGLAELYWEQDRCIEAASLFQRALSIWEQTLGADNPKTAEARTKYAELLRAIHRT